MANRLKGRINAIETKIGTKEELLLELAEKQEKHQGIVTRVEVVRACNDVSFPVFVPDVFF